MIAGRVTHLVAAAADAKFDSAMCDYHAQRFDSAYGALALLADQGHAQAARVALLMNARGPQLYGRRFDNLSPQRRERWLDAAVGPSGGAADS